MRANDASLPTACILHIPQSTPVDKLAVLRKVSGSPATPGHQSRMQHGTASTCSWHCRINAIYFTCSLPPSKCQDVPGRGAARALRSHRYPLSRRPRLAYQLWPTWPQEQAADALFHLVDLFSTFCCHLLHPSSLARNGTALFADGVPIEDPHRTRFDIALSSNLASTHFFPRLTSVHNEREGHARLASRGWTEEQTHIHAYKHSCTIREQVTH